MLIKLALAMVHGLKTGTIVQIISITLILMLALLLYVFTWPYDSTLGNVLQVVSILCTLFTYLIGLLLGYVPTSIFTLPVQYLVAVINGGILAYIVGIFVRTFEEWKLKIPYFRSKTRSDKDDDYELLGQEDINYSVMFSVINIISLVPLEAYICVWAIFTSLMYTVVEYNVQNTDASF